MDYVKPEPDDEPERWMKRSHLSSKQPYILAGDGTPRDDSNDQHRGERREEDKRVPRKNLTGEGRMRGSDDQITNQRNYQEKKIGLIITGLMRAFKNKSIFGGNWDENLDNCIKIFNTMAEMCEVLDEEKLNAIPVILKNEALNYYANHIKGCRNFEEALILLRNWKNNDDKRPIILAK